MRLSVVIIILGVIILLLNLVILSYIISNPDPENAISLFSFLFNIDLLYLILLGIGGAGWMGGIWS